MQMVNGFHNMKKTESALSEHIENMPMIKSLLNSIKI